MDMPLYNAQGQEAGTVGASDALFKSPGNADLVYQVATTQMANRRQKLAHAKGRAEVRGGGRKPWRQKGTGRARHGSIRSPIWKGGGVTHGPTKEAVFKKDINRMMGRRALAAVLSARVTEKRLIAVESLAGLSDGKTKSAVAFLESVSARLPAYVSRKDKHSRILVVLPGTDADVPARRALSNVPYAGTMRAADLNALDVLSYPYVVMTKDAVAAAEKTFASKKPTKTKTA